MKNKIIFYVDSLKPAGGIERVIANLTNKLVDNFEIFVLTKDNEKSFYNLNENIKVISLENPLELNMNSRISRATNIFKSLIYNSKKLNKILTNIEADYIYTTNTINSIEVLLSKTKTKLVISEHGSFYGYNNIYKMLKKFVYPRAYRIVVPTTLDSNLYSEAGYPSVYIPHMNSFEMIRIPAETENIVLNVGRLTKDKQHMELLKIWENVSSNNDIKDWKLLIIGKGEEKSSLEKFISTHNLFKTVEIIDPIKDIESIFSKVKIFSLTSRFEGFGMVLLEAMSFGIPCISFNCPSGPMDIIDNNINGFLIENRDFSEYSKKLLELMTNSKLRSDFSESAYSKALKWDNLMILEKYNSLFNGEL